MTGPIKLECHITLRCKTLQSTNVLAYWVHWYENEILWIRLMILQSSSWLGLQGTNALGYFVVPKVTKNKAWSDEDQNSGRADAEHDVDVLRVLGVMQADAVHGQLLRVLKVVQL